MDGTGLVFIGIDVVEDAVDVAAARRWARTRAPRGLWRRLGVRTGVVVRNPDAPLLVALAHGDAHLRGAARPRRGGVAVVHDAALFHELVEDCPVVEELVAAVLDVSVPAS